MSLRRLLRSTPRGLGRLSSVATRTTRQPSLFQSAWKQASKQASLPGSTAAFSTSLGRFQVNQELAEKLNSEIQIEQSQEGDGFRENLKQYLDQSAFELEDLLGQEEVCLTRKYGDEQIRVVFSVVDFNTQDGMRDPMTDEMYDEEATDMETQSGGANTKGAVKQGRTKGGNFQVAPEDSVAPADREELQSDDDVQGPTTFPVNVQIHVSRKGKGAVTIACVVEEGEFQIQEVFYYPSSDMTEAKTPESDYARRSLYGGPPFSQLDEGVQDLLARYLEERDINAEMAMFIPDYLDMKEQKEYMKWLHNMKTFFD